jgi:hypothetical protein
MTFTETLTPVNFPAFVQESNPNANQTLVRLLQVLFYTKPYVASNDFTQLIVPETFTNASTVLEDLVWELYREAFKSEVLDFGLLSILEAPGSREEKARFLYATFMELYTSILTEDRAKAKISAQADANFYRAHGTPGKPKKPSAAVILAKEEATEGFFEARNKTNLIVPAEHYMRPLRYAYSTEVKDEIRHEVLIHAVMDISRFGKNMWNFTFNKVAELLN